MIREYELKVRKLEVIPDFSLPSNKGVSVGLWDYKHRANLAIFWFDTDRCGDCYVKLREFVHNYSRYKELDCELLAITTASVDKVTELARDLDLPFPLLSDPSASFISRLVKADPTVGLPIAAIVVADRYGALYDFKAGDRAADLPSQEDILDSVFYVDSQCPECGVSEWPVKGA
jgi:peroxiredoxin Q/BCP